MRAQSASQLDHAGRQVAESTSGSIVERRPEQRGQVVRVNTQIARNGVSNEIALLACSAGDQRPEQDEQNNTPNLQRHDWTIPSQAVP